MLGFELFITAMVAIVAVSVAVLPVVFMLRSEHQHLHGSPREWIRRHGRKPESILDIPATFNQTSEERHQELV